MILIRVAAVAAALHCLAPPASSQAWNRPVRGSWVAAPPYAAEATILAAGGAGCEIVVTGSENSAVLQAANFLSADIERISGYRPPIVRQPSSGRVTIRLVTVGNAALPAAVDSAALRGKWEAYEIATTDSAVWLAGSDSRGTAFAAYTLSEHLGIDPLYLWTGYAPPRTNPLVLKPTRFASGAPTIRYRGFFHDDEDILPRPFEVSGYPLRIGDVPLAWYARFFETALRLRMNMVAPYTRAHRRHEVQKLASDWGLFYTSHHYDVLLSNPFGITRFNLAAERGVSPVWDWFGNRDGMVEYWRAGARENRDLNVVWPVGMRGTDDHSYAFPPGMTDSAKNAVFRDVIRAQLEIVKEVVPAATRPQFHFTMYTEMLDRYRADPRAFDLPRDVIIVWPDNNDGRMRALPAERGVWKHGMYYHLAYFGGERTMQSAHVVSPSVVAAEVGKGIDAGATEFLLVNVSEMREFVMEGRMIAEIAWDARTALSGPDPAARYVRWWSAEYFGTPAAAEAAEFYERYHALVNKPADTWSASNAFAGILDRAYRAAAGEPSSAVPADTLALLRKRSADIRQAIALAARVRQKTSRAQGRYFFEHAELPLLVQLRHADAALLIAAGLHSPTKAAFWSAMRSAMVPLETLETEISRAESPPFDGWYRKTWIRRELTPFNLHRPYEQLRVFLASDGRERLIEPPEWRRLSEQEVRRFFPAR